jgi:hypothetical protein
MHFGYAFHKKIPLPASTQYHDFRRAKYALKKDYRYFAKVDITNCFNSFYHHDVVRFLAETVSDTEGRQAGQFLREINSGTSVNCFPQGIYPAKTIGNFYLSFLEESRELRSASIIRFLDDVFLFASRQSTLERDVVVLQQLLGAHSLSLNAEKTQFGSKTSDFDERKLDAIKKSLLRKRERSRGYDEEEDDGIDLEAEEREYLEAIVSQRHVEEEDVELALSLIDDSPAVIDLVRLVCSRFPNLIKQVYRLLETTTYDDEGGIWEILTARIRESFLAEYELFWIAKIILDHYEFGDVAADALARILEHPCATSLVKAVILENEENKHGWLDLKVTQLRDSPSSIAGICALAGLRYAEKSKRNHVCKYIAKVSSYMAVLAGIVARS